MLRADLHLHSNYSDGAYSPEEVVARVAAAGVELCAVTDHDNMEGDAEKRAAAARRSLAYVSGWEVSSYREEKVHILGYRCSINDAYFAFLQKRREGAVLRAQDSIDKANACLGLSLTLEDAEREHTKKDAPLHTMHVVRAFARKLSRKAGKMYEEYFEKGRPAYSGICRPSPEDAIDVIHACGGIAVLAHPGCIKLAPEARLRLAEELTEYGLDGIECLHSLHTQEETERWLNFARARRLLVTGGSDFHRDGTRRIAGLPAFYAGEELLSALGIPS